MPHLAAKFALALALLPPIARGTPQAAVETGDVQKLVHSLSDADPAVRRQASERLLVIGLPARTELIRAARSDEPEERARAAELLRRLPWDAPDDPAPVRSLLSHYGLASDDSRKAIVQQLDRLKSSDRTLLRLLREEPSDSVRWTIAYQLMTARDPAAVRRIREAAIVGEDPPALMLAGRAWIEQDNSKALALLRRAIDADEQRPSSGGGLLVLAYEQLIDAATSGGDYNSAAALLRRRLARAGRGATRRPYLFQELVVDDPDEPVLARLMALHTYVGPLDGFEFDISTWAREPEAAAPTLARGVAFFFARLGAAPPLVCQALTVSAEEHLGAASYLARSGLPEAAELEAAVALTAAPARQPPILHANVAFLRAQLAVKRGDDASAADLLEQGMRIKQRPDVKFRRDEQRDEDIWSEIHYRRAKAAQARGDARAADAAVKELLQLTPSNSDLTLNMIDFLKQGHRAADAKALFEKLYAEAKLRLDSVQDEQMKAGIRNDLAWLCARAGERADEAVQLAQSAVDASPDNPAFLDTLAEAEFRAGNAAAAVRHETRALELLPENAFMKQQLERFRSKKD